MKHQDTRSKIKKINILYTLEAVARHGNKQVVSVLKKNSKFDWFGSASVYWSSGVFYLTETNS